MGPKALTQIFRADAIFGSPKTNLNFELNQKCLMNNQQYSDHQYKPPILASSQNCLYFKITFANIPSGVLQDFCENFFHMQAKFS